MARYREYRFRVGPSGATETEFGDWPEPAPSYTRLMDRLVRRAGFDPDDPEMWVGGRGNKIWVGGLSSSGHPFSVFVRE